MVEEGVVQPGKVINQDLVGFPFKGKVSGFVENDLVGLKGFREHVKVMLMLEDIRVGEVEGLFKDGFRLRELVVLIGEIGDATFVFSKLEVFVKKMEFGVGLRVN